MKNITINSSMRIKIMPFAIHMLFEMFRRRYDTTTSQFNLLFLHQVVKDHITLSNIKHVAYFVLSSFKSRLKLEHPNGLDLDPQLHSATHMSAFSSSDDLLLYSTMLT
jgi:hypothetical protein